MISKLKDTLLLVGDEASDRPLLREIFESSYNLLEAENLPQAALLLEQNHDCIAAILIDLQYVNDSDVQLVNRAAHLGTDSGIPILALIAPSEDGLQEKLAFSRGATDVVAKPYRTASIFRRVQVLVDLHLHQWHLQTLVKEQSEAIRNTNQVMLDALSAIIEHRSSESGNHVLRIRRFTKILLEDVAKTWPEYGLTENTIDIIAGAAALHDIGKISIPDAVLNKPGPLTRDEFEIMKTHTTVGGDLIQNLSGMGDAEYLRYAYNIALYHHERWDGSGYPCGLAGEDIPICAQVVSIADVFDALTSPRVYKPAVPYEQAFNMMLNNECGKFSPKILECFKHVRSQFVALARHYADGNSPKDDAITMPLPGPAWETNPLNTSQLSLVKYQAVLHYLNDTVMELDLDNNLYHVVYNPNPDLDSIVSGSSFRDAADLLRCVRLHPDDVGITDEIRTLLTDEFFRLNLRRKAFPCRIFSAALSDWQHYELTFLRVNTGNESQRIVLAIWHRTSTALPEHSSLLQSGLHHSPALHGLVSTALRCHSDSDLTIDAGAKDLFLLIGYTEEEICRQFDNKLLNLVDPRDRDAFAAAMQEHLKEGGRTETEFRVLCKDGTSLWVLSKSRVYIEADGQEYVYLAIRDNTRGKAVERELKTSIERNQIIVDQSGGIVFEWDLQSDTMYCSPKWEQHFGYPPVSKNYGTQMGIATHFHPDDLPLIRSAIEEIRSHNTSICIDVRIANSAAKYLWTRITATVQLDENGQLSRIIGILHDIDALKRAEEALKERAERDSLTKLLNKASTQQFVSEYLSGREESSLSAMLILDLDNFKLINDNYGHLYGDTVLSQVGIGLKKLFRNHDIIGRIGGDEFLIFMRDIPNEDLVHSRCQLLLETFRDLLAQVSPGLNVSCSIGATLIPAHGTSYTDLFRRADEALYRSKSRGKNTYTLYSPSHAADLSAADSHVSARIDSDEQPGMADSSFVRFVFRRLYESRDIISTFNEILAYVGEQLNVSRVYIFENNDDNTACSNTFEWCNQGITPQIDNLQGVSYITDIPGWPDVFDERGVFYCTDITTLSPQFRAILEPQDIKSVLQCSILDNGVFRGYVGFDECSVHRLWTQDQINLLQFLSEVLSMFLLKKRVQDKVAEQADNLHAILDRQDIWLYVIDPDTCELKFLNEKVRKIAPNGAGKPCYKVIRNRNCRCENCPAANIRQEKNKSLVIENSTFGPRVAANASEIRWNNESACLIFCHTLEG